MKYWEINGNFWSKSKYSEAQAIELSKTLKNCKYCIDCINCEYCENCVDCFNCENCKNCIDCISCIGCFDCVNISYYQSVKNGRNGCYRRNCKIKDDIVKETEA